MPKAQFFKYGTYSYDLLIDNHKFENYHSLQFRWTYVDDQHRFKSSDIYQKQNYSIPYFDSVYPIRLIQNITAFNYELFNAGLYETVGQGFLATDRKTLIIPSFDFKIDSLVCNVQCSPNLYHRFERNLSIVVNGTNYKVYKMYLAPGFNCNEEEQHIVYVDKEIGVIRYEAWDIPSGLLIYQLDFNNFNPQ